MCLIRPQLLWSTNGISCYNELDKTDISHCMFTKKLVFKMLLYTVLLVNLAFGAGKLNVLKLLKNNKNLRYENFETKK